MIKTIATDRKELSKPCQITMNYDHIVRDLLDTAIANEANCAGLAANQIGYNERVIVVKINGFFMPIVNPVLKLKYGGIKSDYEACLSFPGKSKRVRRFKRIKVSFYCPVELRQIEGLALKGFKARIIQHEIDHLNGILI